MNRLARASELDQLELHRVRVLHLVDHDPREAFAVALAELAVGGEQPAREQLEVREVEAERSRLRSA